MEAGQDFVDTLPVYTIMPNPKPSFVASIKLSTDFLEHLQSKGAAGATICFSRDGNVISLGNEQFSFRSSGEHVVSDCYQQVDDELGQPTFNKVGVVKRKIFVEQKLHEEVRKRVKNATETHEKERKSHKSVLLEATGDHFAAKESDKKRKAANTSTKLSSLTVKRPRTTSDPPALRPQPASLSSLAAKQTASTASTQSSVLGSPMRRPPLRNQVMQLLALEALSYEQIESKCTAIKSALASTLQQVAKLKDGKYHLKKQMYKEVDTNWPHYTQEEKLKVADLKNNALKPEIEQRIKRADDRGDEPKPTGSRHTTTASTVRPTNGKALNDGHKEEATSSSRQQPQVAARKVASSRETEQKDKSEKQTVTEQPQLKRRGSNQPSPPSAPSAGLTAEGAAMRKGDGKPTSRELLPSRTEPPSSMTKTSPPDIALDEDYRRRRAEWERKYEEYCDLHQKLKENAQKFKQLGAKLKRASSSERSIIAQQIKLEYQRQAPSVQKMKKRLSLLHPEIKREKAALLAMRKS